MVRRGSANPSLLVIACAVVWLGACAELPGAGLPRHSAGVPDIQVQAATLALPASVVAEPARAVITQAIRQGNVAMAVDDAGAMIAELAAGHPLVVGQAGRIAEVVTGYDLDAGVLLLADGERRALAPWRGEWTPFDGWAVAVLPPGELPASADARTYLRAVGRLEESGYVWEAVLAYDAGVAQWPEDADALAGLAKSLSDLGDQQGASEALAAAIALTHDAAQRDRISRLAAGAGRALPATLRAGSEKALPGPSQ